MIISFLSTSLLHSGLYITNQNQITWLWIHIQLRYEKTLPTEVLKGILDKLITNSRV